MNPKSVTQSPFITISLPLEGQEQIPLWPASHPLAVHASSTIISSYDTHQTERKGKSLFILLKILKIIKVNDLSIPIKEKATNFEGTLGKLSISKIFNLEIITSAFFLLLQKIKVWINLSIIIQGTEGTWKV